MITAPPSSSRLENPRRRSVANETKQNETDKGREEIEAAEEKVLFPDTHRKEIVFCGKEISLRPLPLKWARQLNRAFDKARKYLQEDAKDDDCADEEAANAFLSAAVALCDFYRLGLDRAAIEAAATLPEIMDFCEDQAALQKENDFLLWRLRGHMRATNVAMRFRGEMLAKLANLQLPAAATEIFQSLPSSPALPKPGEDLTLLSAGIPADKSD